MCFHYSLTGEALRQRMALKFESAFQEDYDLFEEYYHISGFLHPEVPVVVRENEKTLIRPMQWGLIPFWTKDRALADKLQNQTLNARSETVFEKPSFREPVKKRRCIVPATGFFEWMHFKGKKYPHYIHQGGEVFAFAGIWDRWVDKETGEQIDSFSILTCEANPLMARIHNAKQRMPLILSDAEARLWLEPDLPFQDLKGLMRPFPGDLEVYSISKRITSGHSNVPEVLEAQVYPELG